MYGWFVSLGAPLLVLYLLVGHPRLIESTFYGFTPVELFSIHAIFWLLTCCLSLLFARSRAVLLGLLGLLYSFALPELLALDYPPEWIGLGFSAAGLCMLAAPDSKLLKINSVIWSGLALILALGLMTVGEVHDTSMAHYVTLALVAVWGSVLVHLRTRRTQANAEWMMLSSLAATIASGWVFSTSPELLSVSGFRLLCLVACLPNLGSIIWHSFRLAYIDELTEIPGRRALVEELEDCGPVFTLAMLDIDHFKKFNDTHGHEVGDQVLRMVAARLASVGGGGTAYRYGGEEFTVIFPGKTTEEVLAELERLRTLVENAPLVLRSPDRPRKKPKNPKRGKAKKKNDAVNVTISIGAATRREDEDWEKVMKRADQALYKAKGAGRNCIRQAS